MIYWLLLMFLLVSVYAAVKLNKMVVFPNVKPYSKTFENEIEYGNFTKEYFNELEREELIITSEEGYPIHGFFFPNGDNKKMVVIAHGYTCSLFCSVKYMTIFKDLGFSVLVYDQRYHGLSGGKSSTFGYKEKDDLKSIVDYLYNRFGEVTLGTHGESLGGATVLMHAAKDKRVDFVVSDCAFSDMTEELACRLKDDKNLPKFPIIYIAAFINKLQVGNYYWEVSPKKSAKEIKAPTLIIHGKEDKYTPFKQGEDIFNALNCPKRFLSVENATHAMSYSEAPELYAKSIKQFLSDHQLL